MLVGAGTGRYVLFVDTDFVSLTTALASHTGVVVGARRATEEGTRGRTDPCAAGTEWGTGQGSDAGAAQGAAGGVPCSLLAVLGSDELDQ